jgi:hypothetical protein
MHTSMVLPDEAAGKPRSINITKILKVLGLGLLAAQSLIFVSFIYQEALQANGFAVRAAIDSRDRSVALDAIARFDSTMRRAQNFQRTWGWVGFWANDSFRSYFGVSCPAQLASYISQGAYVGLWEPDRRRWSLETVETKAGPSQVFVDKWKIDPIQRLEMEGYDVEWLLRNEVNDYLDTDLQIESTR